MILFLIHFIQNIEWLFTFPILFCILTRLQQMYLTGRAGPGRAFSKNHGPGRAQKSRPVAISTLNRFKKWNFATVRGLRPRTPCWGRVIAFKWPGRPPRKKIMATPLLWLLIWFYICILNRLGKLINKENEQCFILWKIWIFSLF